MLLMAILELQNSISQEILKVSKCPGLDSSHRSELQSASRIFQTYQLPSAQKEQQSNVIKLLLSFKLFIIECIELIKSIESLSDSDFKIVAIIDEMFQYLDTFKDIETIMTCETTDLKIAQSLKYGFDDTDVEAS